MAKLRHWEESASVAVVFVLMLLWPHEARAFSGEEHHDATKLAFRVALDNTSRIVGSVSPEMRHKAEWLLADSGHGYDLADVTVAVDWFQGTNILTDETIATSHMATRQNRFIWRLLAAHEDRDHFQKAAIDAYASYHDEAVSASRGGDYAHALFCEAAALHFLEDFLAAGHLVTPRTGFHDVVAASLHDQYNEQGIKATLGDYEREPWKGLLDTLAATQQIEKAHVTITSNDIAQFRKHEGSAIKMKGDDHLQEMRDQKVALVVLAAESISEVLMASVALTDRFLRPCYEPRSGEARPNSSFRPIPGTIHNVSGGFRLVNNTDAWPRVLRDCGGPNSDTMLAFDLRTETGLELRFVDTPGVEVILSSGFSTDLAHRQFVIDVGRIMFSEDPNHSIHIRDSNGRIGANTFSSPFPLEYAAVHFSALKGDGYKALGILEEQATQIGSATGSLLLGVRRYSRGESHAYRFDWGGKIAFGFQVLNVNITVERGHRYGSDRIHQQTFVSPGVDFGVSNTWIRKTTKMVAHFFRKQRDV